MNRAPFLILSIMSVSFAASWPIDSVLARADSCVNIRWTPTTANTDLTWWFDNGSRCTGTDSVYKHCDFKPNVPYTGIAYSYGGEDNYLTFRSRIEDGFGVGSHLCHYNSFGDPSPVITGTDCSGFLCWTWNVPRVSTTKMVTIYPKVAWSDLKAGDALVKPGNHTVLVAEVTSLKTAVIMESTSAVNSCRQRVVDLTSSYWKGYTPVRNNAINDSAVAVSTVHNRVERVVILGSQILLPTSMAGSVELLTLSGRLLFRAECTTGKISIPPQLLRESSILIVKVALVDGRIFTQKVTEH